MSEPTKDELVKEAVDIGVPDADRLTKPQLADAIEARQTPGAGPVAPEGADAPEFEQRGSITGVQPLEADQIPESGR